MPMPMQWKANLTKSAKKRKQWKCGQRRYVLVSVIVFGGDQSQETAAVGRKFLVFDKLFHHRCKSIHV